MTSHEIQDLKYLFVFFSKNITINKGLVIYTY